MASPAHITTKNLSGTWTMNKKLGDSLDKILALQGVGWITRKAIGAAPVTQHIKQYVDANGVEHVDVESVLPGNMKSIEPRVVDGSDQHDKDDLFGHIIRKSTRVKKAELDHDYLKGNCNEPEVEEIGALRLVVSSDPEKSKHRWVLEQVWAFEEINGARYCTERLHFEGFEGSEKQTIQGRLVYDFVKSA
ncbi:hypothetical protein BU17DRAFT_92514 [Hysterangium stoloniferum]|nr:hypothetical protein BU17DRAFT_92514 [Hysterangium stoloniferum]